MSGATISDILSFLRSQLAFHPPFPTSTFEGQTVIVTGANTGLGREAAKHIVRLGAKLVILAVRDLCKGQAASEYVATQTGITDVIQVWQLDLSSFTSVQDFARRATALTRLDAVVENAGMWPTQFESFEGHEATVTVNVLSTLLLARLLLPKLSETAARTDTIPRLTIVSSNLHKFATLESRKAPRILESMKQRPMDFDMRYQDTKLLLHLFGQKLSAHIASGKSPSVCFTIVNPGFCISELKAPQTFLARTVERILARSTDEGARTLVDAVGADKVQGRHGMYIDDMQVKNPAAWLSTTDGRNTAERAWIEIQTVLDDAVAGYIKLDSQA